MPSTTTTTEQKQRTRHADLSGMHRITNQDSAVEDLLTDRALQEGEYRSTITDVCVGTRRDVWGEGFIRDDGNERPVKLGWWMDDPDTEDVTDLLGTWDGNNRKQRTHLGYSDSIYVCVEIPNREDKYMKLGSLKGFFNHGGLPELLLDLIDDYGHLSNFVGKPLIISNIESSKATIEHPATGATRNTGLTSISNNGNSEYSFDEQTLTDTTGAVRYMAARQSHDNPWVSADCELYLDDDAETAALSVDVEGVTRVFKFPVNMDKGTLFRLIVEELGDGTPADLSATVEVAFARNTFITRAISLNSTISQETLAIDTTGCWVLRNPLQTTHNTTVPDTTTTSILHSVVTRLRNHL